MENSTLERPRNTGIFFIAFFLSILFECPNIFLMKSVLRYPDKKTVKQKKISSKKFEPSRQHQNRLSLSLKHFTRDSHGPPASIV